MTGATPSGSRSRGSGSIHDSFALSQLVGTAPQFEEVKRQVHLAARSGMTVLLVGETGTGKELVARAIHYLSDRTSKPFIAIDCGAIPGSLFENEFFGHRPGAFTDARSPTAGLVAEAEGGTLFLDEIDSLTPALQVKLLRFLEDRSYRPLGASRPIHADVRLLAATNAELQHKMAEGLFRQDLYYRLASLQLQLPPLRERGADIVLLAQHFLGKYGNGDGDWRLSPQAADVLLSYSWPGNIRQLENTIRQVMVMHPPKEILPVDFPPCVLAPCILPQAGEAHVCSFRTARAAAIARFERDFLERLLRQYRGNISQAARAARQDRSTFRRLLKKHNLHAADRRIKPSPG